MSVCEGVDVAVGVWVIVSVGVGVSVPVCVAVWEGVAEAVGVDVAVNVNVAVAVGMLPVSTTSCGERTAFARGESHAVGAVRDQGECIGAIPAHQRSTSYSTQVFVPKAPPLSTARLKRAAGRSRSPRPCRIRSSCCSRGILPDHSPSHWSCRKLAGSHAGPGR